MSMRNLPPGCSSPDGGIDHDFDAAINRLCQTDVTAKEIHAFIRLLPQVRAILEDERRYWLGDYVRGCRYDFDRKQT